MKRNSFAYRHIGPKAVDVDQMLSAIGVDSIDTLIDQTVPAAIRATKELDLSEPMTEAEFGAHITALGEMNSVFKTYIGMGYHPTVLPGVIQRNILENPGWYTAYTPYQAEIAQGRLEALMNYQTMVVDLTGMELGKCVSSGRSHSCSRGYEHVLWSYATCEEKSRCE
jgi:glycine dehydrogenase